ncbi:hypothetical protein [Calothrix sp. FACHB-168]|uniref:hypothetical protein n=1 Tax=Calothrix sp. FACHB-168 TaxID=2692780 RepID=UPI001681FE8B|nr:hypothetical protein [Calothrix sp. FACHB-168]MBD2208128.1 hypothetical protein [Calothrix sp. FACHB-168]
MSKKWVEIGKKLAQNLKGVEDEIKIKALAVEIVEQIREAYPIPNSRKNPLQDVRNAVLAVFPDTETKINTWQYFTNKGKGNIGRYQHLAIKYLSLSTEEWDTVGDEARQQWKAEQQEQQPVQTTLDDMNISQLQLDSDTQQMVENAIAHSGISLADFVRRACQVYAKTITGKLEKIEADLTAVPTSDLLSSPTYKTHPGRAEELAKRAIYALENHNNQCTEKNQKWMITQSSIQALTGSKPATIKMILEKYNIRIDDHNNKHGLNAYDNRKQGRKINDDIDLVSLVPDGFYDSNMETRKNITTEVNKVKTEVNEVKTNPKKLNIPEKDIHKMSSMSSIVEIKEYLGNNSGKYVQTLSEGETLTYRRINDDKGFISGVEVLETGAIITNI